MKNFKIKIDFLYNYQTVFTYIFFIECNGLIEAHIKLTRLCQTLDETNEIIKNVILEQIN